MKKMINKKLILSLGSCFLAATPIIVAACSSKNNPGKSKQEFVLESDFVTTINYEKSSLDLYNQLDLKIDYKTIADILEKRGVNAKSPRPSDSTFVDISKDVKRVLLNQVNKFQYDDVLVTPLTTLNPLTNYKYKIINDNSPFVIKGDATLYLKKEAINQILNSDIDSYEIPMQIINNQEQAINNTFKLFLNKHNYPVNYHQKNTSYYSFDELKITTPSSKPNYIVYGDRYTLGFNRFTSELEQWANLDITKSFDDNLLTGYLTSDFHKNMIITNKNQSPFYIDRFVFDLSARLENQAKIQVNFYNNDSLIKTQNLDLTKENENKITYEQAQLFENQKLRNINYNQTDLLNKILNDNDEQANQILVNYLKTVYDLNFNFEFPKVQSIYKTLWTSYHFDFEVNSEVNRIEIQYYNKDDLKDQEDAKIIFNNLMIFKKPTINTDFNYETVELNSNNLRLINSVKPTEFTFNEPTTISKVVINKSNAVDDNNRDFLLPSNTSTYVIELIDENNKILELNYLTKQEYVSELLIDEKYRSLKFKSIKIKPLTLKQVVNSIRLYK